MVGGAKANTSGAKGEAENTPEALWAEVLPEPSAPKFESGRVMVQGEFHLWLSMQGFSFHGATRYDGQNHICFYCEKRYTGAHKPFTAAVPRHLKECPEAQKSHDHQKHGWFFDDQVVSALTKIPDFVWVDEGKQETIFFEIKRQEVAGSVEEKLGAMATDIAYYDKLLAHVDFTIRNHIWILDGPRYAEPNAQKEVQSRVETPFSQDKRLRVYIKPTTTLLQANDHGPAHHLIDGIHHMDSLEGMKQLPDASVDLVITSPPYADMKVYEGGFNGFHPDEYVRWFLPYVSEIARILKPTGSFILNINDKVVDTFRHPFLFELIYAIHNPEKYARAEMTDPVSMHGLRLYERLFWNKGKYLANPRRFGDKLEYLFWFSKTRARKLNMDAMRMVYDEKSVKRMERPLIKRFVRESGEEVTEYKDGGSGSWRPNPLGALPSTLIEEGAMKHVHPIVETFDEGTAVVLDDLGDGVLHAVWPRVGEAAAPSTLVTIGSETRRILGSHVAVYPERLVSYFVQGATDEGDVVLDPFSGTGTTAVVAKALGRQYIAFDISEEYVNFGRERLERGPYLEELKRKTPRKGGLFDF